MIKKLLLWTGAVLTGLMSLTGLVIFVMGVYGSFVVEEGAVDVLAAGINGLTIAICTAFFSILLAGFARNQ